MPKTLLVLIDLQTDFLQQKRLEPHPDTIIDAAAALLEAFRKRGAPVAHVITKIQKDHGPRMPHWREHGIEICVDGTPGCDLPDVLKPAAGERVFEKIWFSAFADPSFEIWLRGSGIKRLVLAGIHVQTCLRQTALDAYQKGFEVCIAADACGSHDPMHGALSLDYMSDRAMPAYASADIIAQLDAGGLQGSPKTVAKFGEIIKAARAAQTDWAAQPMPLRIEFLQNLATEIAAKKAEFAGIIVEEVKKPVFYASGEVERTLALIAAVAARALAFAETKAETEGMTCYRPRGVIAIITPWNNPLAIPAGKLAPALAYGNSVIWKPAPAAMAVARALMDCLARAGMPEHLVQLVDGDASSARRLIGAGVDAVAFSGSSKTGWSMIAQTASRLLPLQAELGGNNAAIICPSADLATASEAIAEGAFGFAGQRCTANRRVIILEEIYDDFLNMLKSATAKISCGDPENVTTRVSPMISAQAAGRIARLVKRARQAGYDVLEEAARLNDESFHPPVIICCDEPEAFIVQEESFGPILVVQKAVDFADALRLLNQVAYGLVAAIFSHDQSEIEAFKAAADAGILKINASTINAGVDIPFTGWKHSGFGAAEHGEANQEFFTKRQAVYATGAGKPA
jgi:acyl-CoA reductase-like NAD-dependent aldehyde dehydrogenase/nicotinamidase-related amidase